MKKLKQTIHAEYEKEGLIAACDLAVVLNKNNTKKILFEWCVACDNHTPSFKHECACCGQTTKLNTKPKFYQAILKPIKDVIAHVYPQGGVTLEERMGLNANCSECGCNEWMLLAKKSIAVVQGGKVYCECLGCGSVTHL